MDNNFNIYVSHFVFLKRMGKTEYMDQGAKKFVNVAKGE